MEGLLKFAPRPTGAGEMFQILRFGPPRTRAELGVLTGHSRTVIAARLDSLLAEGLIERAGEATSTGGRPPTEFRFNPTARVVAGVDVEEQSVQVGISDLSGEVLATRVTQNVDPAGPSVTADWIASEIRALVGEAGCQLQRLAGIGLGLPGGAIPEFQVGISERARRWRPYDVAAVLQEDFHVPVVVESPVNTRAIGELRFNWPETENLLFVWVGDEITSAIVLDGQVRRGAQGLAGDIGHLQVAPKSAVECACGNVGCLQAVLRGRIVGAKEDLSDPANHNAQALLRNVGRDIGLAVSACVSILNPSAVVVSGPHAIGDQLVAGIREVVYANALPRITESLQIKTSDQGQLDGVRGCAYLAIENALSQQAIELLVQGTERPEDGENE